MDDTPRQEVATFAAGCFWDTEALFRREEGIVATRVGYTGGTVPEPTYDQVSSGCTGHAEAIQVIFDPHRIPYQRLLDLFLSLYDPSHEQGGITRAVIFYHTEEQKAAAEASRDRVQGLTCESTKVEILPAAEFWSAEDCHQQYYEKCGRGYGTSRKYWE